MPPIEAKVRLKAVSKKEFDFDDETMSELESKAKELRNDGFKEIGFFEDQESEDPLIVSQNEKGIFAVIKNLSEKVIVEYCAYGKNKCAYFYTPNPVFPEVDNDSSKVRIIQDDSPSDILPALSRYEPFQPLGVRHFIPLYEKIFSSCIELRLSNRDMKKMVGDWMKFQELEPLNDEDMDHIYTMLGELFNELISKVIADKVRVSLSYDEDNWSRIKDDLLILHRYVKFEDLLDYFDDELVEELIEQFEEQKMSVAQIFKATNQRLTREQQYTYLTGVSRPIPAEVYLKTISLESIDSDVAETKPGPGVKRFLYQSLSPDNDIVKGSLVAAGVADARSQLQRLGHRDIRILSSNHDFFKIDDLDMELFPDQLVDAHKDAILLSVFKIVLGNWVIWAPFAIWAAYVVYNGKPYGWPDWAGISFAAISFIWAFSKALPAVVFEEINEARSWGRPEKAQMYLRLWRRIGGMKQIGKVAFEMQEATILAEMGQMQRAITLLETHRDDLDTLSYLAYKSQIHNAGRDYPESIKANVKMVQEDPENMELKVDLALALLRHTKRVKEAEELLTGLHQHNCSELFVNGLHFAQGLLHGRQGHTSQAVKKLQQALSGFADFTSPISSALQAEISGYIAVFLHQAGEKEKSGEIWQRVSPRLIALKADHVLSLYQGRNS
ncbi:MAG: hypothetical protein OEV64_07565 [Desulfobulbaceae bacterium]|nr:hypothetical protein [Desulfobulbaceae bacterium]